MKKSLIVILLCLIGTSASAQNNSALYFYEQAEQEYQIGRVDQARELLQQHLDIFKGTVRQSAYRLLSLCAIADDDDTGAEIYANEMLKMNPFYNPTLNDPQLFADLINRLKTGRTATISTASRQAESLEEAPVPVTLITEEMIRLSTARNLLELLADYVPGFSTMFANSGQNFSTRGVLLEQPDHILFLRNGVRLNSYYDNSMPPAFSISLASIKQIEVLRGGGSSLYGNTALTGVVNIITKDAADIDGIQLSAGGGNTHTFKADAMFGKQLLETSVMAWGTFYNSWGTRWEISGNSLRDNYTYTPRDGYLYIGGYNHKPSYELGLNLRWKGMTLYLTHQTGKYVRPNYEEQYDLYDYDNSWSLSDGLPGCGSTVTTANLGFSHTWKDFTLDLNARVSREVNITEDMVSMWQQGDEDVETDGDEETDNTGPKEFVYEYGRRNELYNIGADVKGVYSYALSGVGQGNLLMGIQAEVLSWDREQVYSSSGREEVGFRDEGADVSERTYSAFLQLKHSFSPGLILNGGLRYDYRDRAIGDKVDQFSPRLSLVYIPDNRMNFKLSYAHSFVDLTIDDRQIFNNDDYKVWLDPQSLDIVQLTSAFQFPSIHLKYETNLFYHFSKTFRTSDYYFLNTKAQWMGWENVLSYNRQDFLARLTATWQHRLSFKNTASHTPDEDESLWNVLPVGPNATPDLSVIAQLSKRLLPGLWLTAKGSFASKSTFRDFLYNANDPTWVYGMPYDIDVPANFLLDLNARYTWRNLELSVLCKNVLNHTYRLASEHYLLLQQRRVLLATLTVNLH